MVKKADIDERKNLFKASDDRLVCLGRFYGPRRVVVENNKSGRIKFQSPLQNDTRVNGRAIDSAIEQFFSGNDPVTVIKKNRSKDFILPICEKKL